MKGITPLVFVIIALAALVILSGGTFLPGQIVTKEDVVAGCKLAETTYYTIGCDPVGSPVTSKIVASTTGTSFTINTVETQISGLTIPPGVSLLTITTSSGSKLCEYVTFFKSDGCTGKSLVTGQTYTAKQDCPFGCSSNAVVTMTGRPLQLTYTDDRGLFKVPIPASNNCIRQDISQPIIDISGSVPDKNEEKAITLQQGQALTGNRAYRELPSIIGYYYQNTPATCDFVNKKVYGYTKYEGVTGQCYAIPDAANTLLDGKSYQYFCCSDSNCQAYGLGSDYLCSSNQCQKKPSTAQCIVDNDCGFTTQYIESSAGVIQREGKCQSGTCSQIDTQIACNPTRLYPDNKCCRQTAFGWQLQPCTTSLKACDQLGADACCTSSQSQYTVKEAPIGKYCCDKDSDGVGKVVASSQDCYKDEICTPDGQRKGLLGCCSGLVEQDGVCVKPGVKPNKFFEFLVTFFSLFLLLLIVLGIAVYVLPFTAVLPFLAAFRNPRIFLLIVIGISLLIAVMVSI